MARLLDSVLGHKNQIHHLLESFQGDHLPQTFLFVGPSGIGKKQVALGLAQAILCETGKAGCGHCPSCLRVAKGGHESLRLVLPEKNLIKIEQTRAILDFLSLRSISANRVVIIDEAELMNPQAANSLLKILEEPAVGTYFFLLAPSPTHVLSTLRSRSQIVRFQPLTQEQMKNLSPAPDWALRASLGSFERLKEFQDAGEIEARGDAQVFLRTLLQDQQGHTRPEVRAGFKERSHALSLARHLSLFLRDVAFWQAGERNHLLNLDQSDLLADLAQLPIATILKWSEKALDLEKSLLQNRDSSLVFEQFWIESQNP